MGSFQSSLVISAAVAVVGLGVAYVLVRPMLRPPPTIPTPKSRPGSATAGKKGKKNKPSPAAAAGEKVQEKGKEKHLPGALLDERDSEGQTTTTVPDESSAPASAVGKKKKKKSKSSPAPQGTVRSPAAAPPGGPSAMEADGPWTRVETRRRASARGSAPSSVGGAAQSGSDRQVEGSVGDVTTSVTEEESGEVAVERGAEGEMRSTVERMLPKPRKTAVDDMLETPAQSIARVVRVKPSVGDKPAAGFSWADYEDVEGGGGMADEADDEGEWGIVKSRNRRSAAQSAFASFSSSSAPVRPAKAPETLTKKQRQNARKREADKSAKGDQEAERLAALARHKRELEEERMRELAKGAGAGRKPVSGGMRASVNDKGALVWE
ncbi:hypothetical protein CALVIDRAFT_532530 [Calocera viscosa TUFC12733]|uniref:Uncharacterized protein n=1 Tax=Calocera viscosa (strain TUFC12733) TaxID=1330018 RepID=A0A167SBW8_CALVF|nr:hypothetical protein CALVIDRAFT_532530 [Calocera viscosa TUFC12733]